MILRLANLPNFPNGFTDKTFAEKTCDTEKQFFTKISMLKMLDMESTSFLAFI